MTIAGVTLGLCTAVFVTHIDSAQAATISPPRLELAGDPGAQVSGQIKLSNDKLIPQTFFLFARDFEAQDESGNPQFVTSSDGFSTWLDFPPSVTLGPRGDQTIVFTAQIPGDIEPGGYFAAVFASTEEPASQPGQVAVQGQIGTLVFLRVNGDVPESTSILEFGTTDRNRFYTSLPISFYYRFQNSGNDRVLPLGDIIITNTIGRTTKIIPANPTQGNVLPKSIRRFNSTWEPDHAASGSGFWPAVRYEASNFALGLYTAHLNIAYGNTSTQTASATYKFFVFPWQLILVVVVGLAVILVALRFFLRHYNRRIIARAKQRK